MYCIYNYTGEALPGAGELGTLFDPFVTELVTDVFFPTFSFSGGVTVEGEAEGDRERVDSRVLAQAALQEGGE